MAEISVEFNYKNDKAEICINDPYISWAVPMDLYEEYMFTGDFNCFGKACYISGISSNSSGNEEERFKNAMEFLRHQHKQSHDDEIDVLDIRNAPNLLFFADNMFIYCKNIRTGEQVIVGKVGE